MPRQHGMTIHLTQLGSGETVLDIPPEQLLPPENVVSAPANPSAENLHLKGGYVRTRTGYRTHYNAPASTQGAVTGLFLAQFTTGNVQMLRGDQKYICDNTLGTAWATAPTVVLGTGTGDAASDYWRFAMVRNAGTPITSQVFMSNGNDARDMYAYTDGSATSSTPASAVFKAPRAIVGMKGRAIVGNTYETVGTDSVRQSNRVRWSIVGDPEDFSGVGSGFTDLDDDTFPITQAAVVSGNLCIFKSTQIGGSVTVGTLTGNVATPYRFDTINTAGMSLLFPRTFVQIDPSVCFFVGHDGFYLYDGTRGLLPIAQNITKTIMPTLNYSRLDAGFAYYKPKTFELVVGLPTGSATYPNIYYTINMRERRVYGPSAYDIPVYCACPYISTTALTWNDLVGYTWDTLPYDRWSMIGGSANTATTLFGDTSGYTWEDDDITLTDNGAPITGTYTTAAIVPAGRKIITTQGQERTLQFDDAITLRDISLVYVDAGAWTPIVKVSVDGGSTWTIVSDGVVIGGTDFAQRTKSYTVDDISGNWFQFKVSGGYQMRLVGIRAEFTYTGSERAYGN